MLPHGGKLIERIVSFKEKQELLKNAHEFKTISLNEEQIKDIKNIARGVYSPLKGFLKEDDFGKVVTEMRLSDGTVWPIPIVLDISKKEQKRIKKEKDILLINSDSKPVALLENIQSKNALVDGMYKKRAKAKRFRSVVYRSFASRQNHYCQ